MIIKVTRTYTLDERKTQEWMKEHGIKTTAAKEDFYNTLSSADVYLLEKLSVYHSNVTTVVEKKEGVNDAIT